MRNEKGQMSMQKVKVHRYVSGKRPDYAQDYRSDSDSDNDDFLEKRNQAKIQPPSPAPEYSDDEDLNDPRLRRLRIREIDTEVRPERRRHIMEPEVLEESEEEEPESVQLPEPKHTLEAPDDDESEAELSDGEIERKRELLKKKMLIKQEEHEIMAKEEEKSCTESSDSSEYEEYTDSEEETGPRLKPVFVRKRDRITVIEKEKQELKEKQLELEAQKQADDRRRQTVKMVEDSIRKEQQLKEKESHEPSIDDVSTDDDNDEIEYEAWKLRELKRIKRDREEREAVEKEKLDMERLRNMTEEERRLELRLNPKQVTNKAVKGKYKFLQKYYHRGAFYLNEDDDVYKRDFSQATLDDHFDKTILPKVMQVKNFGRSGRTKYTHLVDQDTTQFDSPWTNETPQNIKFHSSQAGGSRQVFERPSKKRKNSAS